MKNWRIFSIHNKRIRLRRPAGTPNPRQPAHSRSGRLFLFAVLLLAVFASAVLSMCAGTVFLSPDEVVASLSDPQTDSIYAQIVRFARLPRTCGCLLAGAALAVSGAVIQSVLSNPLAAPNIIGVNSGAGFAVAVCGALAPTAVTLLPIAAFAGALGGVLLVLFLSERTGASRITLVLAGVAVSSLFSAGIDAVITFVPDALAGYSDFRIGGLSNLSMARIRPASRIILIAFLVIFSLTHELDILMLGSDTAHSLGLPVKPIRLILLAAAAALAGAAVSFCGLLGFVGLIVPHIMRRLAGEENLPLLAASALGGAAFLTFCDLISRTLFSPYELSVGIVLACVGAPFFLWLLLRNRGGEEHD